MCASSLLREILTLVDGTPASRCFGVKLTRRVLCDLPLTQKHTGILTPTVPHELGHMLRIHDDVGLMPKILILDRVLLDDISQATFRDSP